MADQGAEGLFSAFLRRRRVEAAVPHLRGRVLDYGCASGVLADFVDPSDYLGVDIDPEVVELARRRHPRHAFDLAGEPICGRFDTIVSLAVIEHVENPAGFLAGAAALLAPGGSIVLTTPHPRFRGVHDLGARLGLFSRAASEEHQKLLDGRAMRRLAFACGLDITGYRRFLFGANQLFVLRPKAADACAGAERRSVASSG